MSTQENLIRLLSTLGFQEKEALIYLKSHEINHPASVGKLAKLCNINRGTAYHTVYEMKKKGYLKSIIVNDVIHFVAEPIQKLKKNLEEEEHKIQIKKKLLDETASVFKNIIKDEKQIEEIKLFVGEDQVMAFYNSLPWEEYHYCIFSADSFDKIFPAETYYGTGSLENLRKTQGRLLISKTNTPAHKKCIELISLTRFEYKEIEDGTLSTDTMIFDDFVAIVYLDPKNLHGVRINCRSLIESYKKMFERVWERLK